MAKRGPKGPTGPRDKERAVKRYKSMHALYNALNTKAVTDALIAYEQAFGKKCGAGKFRITAPRCSVPKYKESYTDRQERLKKARAAKRAARAANAPELRLPSGEVVSRRSARLAARS